MSSKDPHTRCGRDPILSKIDDAYENGHAASCVLLATDWLRNHPDDLWVITCCAEMLYKMARYEEAVGLYTDTISRFPEHRSVIYSELGHLSRYQGDFAQARVWYQRAIDANPDEAGYQIFLGAVYARIGNLDLAEQAHRRATACRLGSIDEAYYNLGLVLRGQGRLTEAKECFELAVSIDAKYEDALVALMDVEVALEMEESNNIRKCS